MSALVVRSYAVAGAAGLPLPEARVCALPPPGPKRRTARLPGLAVDLALRAVGGGGLGEDGSVFLGTALGCLTETQQFVENMIRADEAAPMPRAFSSSVHNAVSSAVALRLGARGENQTFVHGALSFVLAAFAAERRRRRAGGASAPLLLGAVDELTEYVLRGREGCPAARPRDAGEGGAILVCGGDGPPLARIARVAFGVSDDPAGWVSDAIAGDDLDLLLVPGGGIGGRSLDALPGAQPYLPWCGDHPAAPAVAAAAAVALVAGEAPPDLVGRTAPPLIAGVVAVSRFGDVGLVVVRRA